MQLIADGVKFTPAAMRAIGIADTGLVMRHVLLAALCFHSYQQVPKLPLRLFVGPPCVSQISEQQALLPLARPRLRQHQSTCWIEHPHKYAAAAQVSYMILQRVSPVTHSIGNCLKRVIVIVASVIVFQNPMSRQNMIGAAPTPPWRVHTAGPWSTCCWCYVLRSCMVCDAMQAPP